MCGADTEPVCPVVICPSSMWGGHWLVTDTRPDFVYNLTIPGVRPVHLHGGSPLLPAHEQNGGQNVVYCHNF